MSGINLGRVVVGGIVAGVLIDIGESVLTGVVLGPDMTAFVARLGLPPMGSGAMAAFAVLGLALGIVAVWLYAAVRPRFGAGPKAALYAGGATWLFAYAYPNASMALMGMLTMRIVAIGLLWGLAEVLIATVAGAYFYKE